MCASEAGYGQARSGAALLLVLLLLFLLDCIVLGSVHLAVIERRLAQNVDTALRLRLHAESAVREAAAAWGGGTDSLVVGATPHGLLHSTAADNTAVSATVQRIAEWAFLIRGEAALLPPRHGRAAAALLVRPPALPPDVDPAAAALVAGQVRLGVAAAVDSDVAAILVHDLSDIEPFGLDQVRGGVDVIDDRSAVMPQFDRLVLLFDPPAGSVSRHHDGSVDLGADFTGALVVDGDLRVAAGVTARGLIVVRGRLLLEADARIEGAAHVAGRADVDGSILFDGSAVEAAVRDAGLREPGPFRGRAWVPAF